MTRGCFAQLILLRHGQSEWNESDRFTGWMDVSLSTGGMGEAAEAGDRLAAAGLLPDVAFTSVLTRAILTSNIALERLDRQWVPVTRAWQLNERHYGALAGREKAEVLAEVGPALLQTWRRGYDGRPPACSREMHAQEAADTRYAGIDPPRSESLSDVVDRMLPFWRDVIVPRLRSGRTALLTAHGTVLRGLVMHLETLPRDRAANVAIPTATPLVYGLDDRARPIGRPEMMWRAGNATPSWTTG